MTAEWMAYSVAISCLLSAAGLAVERTCRVRRWPSRWIWALLLAGRLARLPEAACRAVDILAVWEPAGLTTLEAIVGADQLELLDRSGLLTVRSEGRRQQVGLAHPLYGEILRARMPTLARRHLGIYPTTLPDVCRRLRIPLRHHDPLSDAEACARIVIAALRRPAHVGP